MNDDLILDAIPEEQANTYIEQEVILIPDEPLIEILVDEMIAVKSDNHFNFVSPLDKK